ncbi:hypothetical protein PSN_1096 [Pseudomonas sp. NGC7]
MEGAKVVSTQARCKVLRRFIYEWYVGGACRCRALVKWCSRDRAPPARRIASNARSYVCFGPIFPVALARGPLAPDTISSRTNKAVARLSHRLYWPETNVGASVARDAPRGRRSILRASHHSSPTPRPSAQRADQAPWHFLNFFSLPQGQGSLRPTSFRALRTGS